MNTIKKSAKPSRRADYGPTPNVYLDFEVLRQAGLEVHKNPDGVSITGAHQMSPDAMQGFTVFTEALNLEGADKDRILHEALGASIWAAIRNTQR